MIMPRVTTGSLPLEEAGLDGDDDCPVEGPGRESDPLTPQRRGFIDTIFTPWNSLRSALSVEKARYAHVLRAGPRCPLAAALHHHHPDDGSPNHFHLPTGGGPHNPFGCLPELVDDLRAHHPRRACADGWWRWVLGLCKCRHRPPGCPAAHPGGGGRGSGDDPVLLLAVNPEGTGRASGARFRYLTNGWRLSPAPGRDPDQVQGHGKGVDLKEQDHELQGQGQKQIPCQGDDTQGHPTEGQNRESNGCKKGSPKTEQRALTRASTNPEGFDPKENKQVVGGYPALRLVQECRRRRSLLLHSHRARRSAIHMAEYLVSPAMLQQILKDMYIDPELLAELDDEQKQVLFCKLREEQIRRWKEKEDKLEKEEKKQQKKSKPPGKNGKRHIGWLLGTDQNIWVWVMGDHEKDKSIEQIIEEEAQDKARKQAEQEGEALARTQEQQLQEVLQQEKLRLEEDTRRRQADLRKKAEKERLEDEKKKQEIEEQEQMKLLRVRHELQRRKSIDEINQIKQRRSSEIYMSYVETRHTIEKLAEEDSKEIESEWLEQEKKSKAAEEEIRAIARRAREEHRRSMSDTLRSRAQVIGKVAAGLQDVRLAENKPPVPSKPPSLKVGRPPKPPNRRAIVDWFREVEYPKGIGRNPTSKQVEPWFHGIITRQDAEDLLQNEPQGTFLVRVSERIWGYAVSYRGQARCKHFLIDAAGGNYQFFGTHQIAHAKLADLVSFHKVTPISNAGQEKLVRPCQQKQSPPNYQELFPEMASVTL